MITSSTMTTGSTHTPAVIITNVSICGNAQRVNIVISDDGIISDITDAADTEHSADMEDTGDTANTADTGDASDTENIADTAILANLSPAIASQIRIIDASGLVALPGLVDLHVHLREPGREDAETIASGSLAAAAGGFTAIFAMPNTDPVADNAVITDYVYTKGQDIGLVDVFPIGAVTKGQQGTQLAEMGLMHAGKAQVRIFSDDGKCVADSLVMKRALEYAKSIDSMIAQHAEDPQLTAFAVAHDGPTAARLGLAGWPRSAEEIIVARDIILAEETGAHIHFCHISTAGSVELIRSAKRRGIAVTAEVSPHHLLLDDSNLSDYNPVYRVNPPIRENSDIYALRQGLWDGTIDCVATDHAPHVAQDKICEFSCAKPGMIGLETALGVVALVYLQDHVVTNPAGGASAYSPASSTPTPPIDWNLIAQVMSINPAKIARATDHGCGITIGCNANLVLVDPDANWTVTYDDLYSQSDNSPYIGLSLPAKPVATFHNGKNTYFAPDFSQRFRR